MKSSTHLARMEGWLFWSLKRDFRKEMTRKHRQRWKEREVKITDHDHPQMSSELQ